MLFEKLFDIQNGAINKNILSLDNKTFKETFNKNKLAFILLNKDNIEQLYSKERQVDDSNVTLLTEYYNNSKSRKNNGSIDIKYFQKKNDMYGRYMAISSIGAQGMKREIRHTIFNEHYTDIDIDNCHPTITQWLCNNLNIDCVYLTEYINNRESIIEEVMRLNKGMIRDTVKTSILAVSYGQGESEFNKTIPIKSTFLINFCKEIKTIQHAISSAFSVFYNITKTKRENDNKPYNHESATLSNVCLFVENQLLMHMYFYLQTKIKKDISKCVLCFDGIMIPTKKFKESYLEDIKNLYLNMGIQINLSVKVMKPLNLEMIGYDYDENYILKQKKQIKNTTSTESVCSDNSTTPISSCSSSTESNCSDELKLLKSPFTEADIIDYILANHKDIKIVFDEIYMFNDVYWQKSERSVIVNILDNLHKKLTFVINEEFFGDNEAYCKLIKKILKLRTTTGVKSIYEMLKLRIEVNNDIFDLNIDLLGFNNGVYDLNTDEFREGRAEDYVSMNIPYDFKEVQDLSSIESFISKIMPIKEERDLLLLTISTALSGRPLNHFNMCSGIGSNGKDTLFNYLLYHTLGEYYYRGSNTTLTKKINGDLNVSISNMNKKRLVLFNEPDEEETIKVAQIKELTGGNTINSRTIYSKNTTVNLHGTIFVLCNDKPLLNHVDQAMANRLINFPFRSVFKDPSYMKEHSIQEGENYIFKKDEMLKETGFIETNKLQLMNLLIQYYRKFKQDGYLIKNIPDSIKKESEEYMNDSDPFLNWLNVLCVKTTSKSDVIKIKDIHAVFLTTELYKNMNKQQKRNVGQKNKMIDSIKKSPTLRMFYKERIKIDGVDFRNVLTNYKSTDEFNEELMKANAF